VDETAGRGGSWPGINTKKAALLHGTAFFLSGARDQIRTGIPFDDRDAGRVPVVSYSLLPTRSRLPLTLATEEEGEEDQ